MLPAKALGDCPGLNRCQSHQNKLIWGTLVPETWVSALVTLTLDESLSVIILVPQQTKEDFGPLDNLQI